MRLRESLAPHLPYLSGTGKRATLQVFGSKELHEAGSSRYRVVLAFNPILSWRNTRKRLLVFTEVDGHREVDTTDLLIKKKPAHESPAKFLANVQAHCAKGGNVFGERIQVAGTKALSQKWKWAEISKAETRQDTERMAKEFFSFRRF